MWTSRWNVFRNGRKARLTEEGERKLDETFDKMGEAFSAMGDGLRGLDQHVVDSGELKKAFERLAKMAQLVRVLAVRGGDEEALGKIDKLAGDIQQLAETEARKLCGAS